VCLGRDIEGRGAFDDASGEVAESHSVSAGVGPELGEDVRDAESGACGEHAESLFDDDAVVECAL
jgi:hypothetical protein